MALLFFTFLYKLRKNTNRELGNSLEKTARTNLDKDGIE